MGANLVIYAKLPNDVRFGLLEYNRSLSRELSVETGIPFDEEVEITTATLQEIMTYLHAELRRLEGEISLARGNKTELMRNSTADAATLIEALGRYDELISEIQMDCEAIKAALYRTEALDDLQYLNAEDVELVAYYG